MKVNPHKKDKINIITLGCSKNLVDSEMLMGQLKHNQFEVVHESEDGDSNIVVINTCGFIENAKQESIDTILEYAEAKERGTIDKLYVTGCLSERYKDDLKKEIDPVDAWFGTRDLPALLNELGAEYRHELIGERQLTTPSHYAYLKISEGCNRTCAFCAIPLMRGKHISITMEELVEESRKLARNGVKELILIAQELTYYGLDIYKKRMLHELLRQLSDVEGIEWIRLHYAYPNQFPVEVIDVMKERDNICNYLDIPLQHASDNILQRMKRQTNREEMSTLIKTIRDKIPGVALRTTMLVGFPGETEEDMDNLLNFIEEHQFDRLGTFTYSHEDGTSGFEYEDDVPESTKQERASRVMELQESISFELNQKKVGNTYKTLIDRVEGEHYIGRTEFDSPEVDNEVLIPVKNLYLRIGDFADITINEATAFDIFGVHSDS